MKKLLYTFTILLAGTAFAQDADNPVDHMETTQVKTKVIEKDGKMVESKVKVVTKKEQEVMTNPNQSHLRDADQIIAPTKVTKTVSIDNDNDKWYDSSTTISYYNYDNVKYAFRTNQDGFVMTSSNGEKDILLGTAIRTGNGNTYLFNTPTYNGVGYYDANGNFVVEYYNSKLNKKMKKTFETEKL